MPGTTSISTIGNHMPMPRLPPARRNVGYGKMLSLSHPTCLGGRSGLLPQCECCPIRWDTHAAQDEWRCCLEQGAASVFPFGFRANDAHAVGTERKNRECRRVGERRLAVETFDKWRESRGRAKLSGDSRFHVPVPKTRMVSADVSCILERHEKCDESAWPDEECVGD